MSFYRLIYINEMSQRERVKWHGISLSLRNARKKIMSLLFLLQLLHKASKKSMNPFIIERFLKKENIYTYFEIFYNLCNKTQWHV